MVIRYVKLWLPVVVWAALIFGLSSIPDLRSPLKYDPVYRKFAHIFEYAVLAYMLSRALKGSGVGSFRTSIILGCMGSVMYAVSDEFHQTFVPGRSGSWMDVVIDSAGVLLGVVLYGVWPV